ncbi:MAG: cell division protein FtsA [Candidatus Omnitrophota bacterium]
MHKDVICSLDIGSSFIRALIAQASSPDLKSEKILSYCKSPTKGFSKGVVTNISLLSDAIEETVNKAEIKANVKIRKVIANISGVHIRTFKSRGSVHISDRPSEITEEDITRCIESARLIAMSLDREVLELISEKFYIDDKLEIDDPHGLFGSKLDVDLNIITSLVSILHNLTKAINLAGYEVEDIVTSARGTSLAIFDEKRLEEGAILIDVGKDVTEVALFDKSRLRDCFYFPFGSDDLTQVLQDKLRILFEEAEELRIKYGIVTKSNQEMYDSTEVLIPSIKDREHKKKVLEGLDVTLGIDNSNIAEVETKSRAISRREISNLLSPKIEDIMQDVYKKIEPFLKERRKVPYTNIIGGVSKMDGFIESVEEIFGIPIEMGRLYNADDMKDDDFSCALGLFRLEARRHAKKRTSSMHDARNIFSRLILKIKQLFAEYF